MKHKNLQKITDLRHELHMYPELSMQETETAARLRKFLEDNTGFQVVDRGNWFYAVHKGKGAKNKIAFRADMDALPITEDHALSYHSRNEGVSHKCGHDGHCAALCGLALELDGKENDALELDRKEKDTETWKLYKKVDLTADTAWEYHWGAADDGASWTVTERDVPEGYVLQTPIRLAHNAANTKMEFRVTNISNTGEDTPTTTPPTGTPPTDTPTPTPKTKTPTPKPPTKTPTPKPANISLSVVKKWQTASGGTLSNSQTGVSSLTVDIYRKYPGSTSYTKVDSVELLPSNNWTHSWTAPNDGSTWTVTEPRIPSGYTKVGITQTSNSSAHTKLFTITNKKTSGSGATPTTRSVTRKVTATATPKVTGSSRTLPNTGDNQNVWIPLITMFGAAVVLVVLIRKRTR